MCQRLNNELPNNNGTKKRCWTQRYCSEWCCERAENASHLGVWLTHSMVCIHWLLMANNDVTFLLLSLHSGGTQADNGDWKVLLQLLGLKDHVQQHWSDSRIKVINHWVTLVASIWIYPLWPKDRAQEKKSMTWHLAHYRWVLMV